MKLIVLNGPCGVGKSTIALELQKVLPLSLLIDVGALRRTIGGYKQSRAESLKTVYEDTVALAGAHLKAGYSVIVEKVVFTDDWFLDDLKEQAEKHDAEFFEIVLMADKQTIVSRAEARGFRPDSALTPEKVVEFWELGQVFLARRTGITVVDIIELSINKVAETVKKIVL